MSQGCIFFRADANSDIGLGHVTRCLTIAKELMTAGKDPIMILADETAAPIVARVGVPYRVLGTRWSDPESELEILDAVIEELGPEKIVLDSYFVTKNYMEHLRKKCALVYIDDIKQFRYPCDMLINYNIYAEDMHYEKEYRKDTKLVLGSGYVPLREEFRDLPPRRIDEVRKVLITTGGADVQNTGMQILRMIDEVRALHNTKFHFVLGSMSTRKEAMLKYAEHMNNVVFNIDVQNMSRLMLDCDLAVSAAGTTLHELCACGTPAITYVCADNQMDNARKFEKLGVMINAGDCRKPGFSDNLRDSLCRALHFDGDVLNNISRKMQKLNDGQGAVRLAEEIARL